ncbi:MAG: hypothetical protein U0470_08030 [Anaerolineae bacterium]
MSDLGGLEKRATSSAEVLGLLPPPAAAGATPADVQRRATTKTPAEQLYLTWSYLWRHKPGS